MWNFSVTNAMPCHALSPERRFDDNYPTLPYRAWGDRDACKFTKSLWWNLA